MRNSVSIEGSELSENPEHRHVRELTEAWERWADQRRPHLENLIVQCEARIIEAEGRIERHHRLWGAIDGSQQRVHLHLDVNLLAGLQILFTYRAMLIHELIGIRVPRRLAALHSSHEMATEQADAARYAHLKQVIAWLDAVSAPVLCTTIAGQRHRATYEMWEIQKRQLRRRAQLFS